MLAYSSPEEISAAVEAKYSRIALNRLSELDISTDERLSYLSETIPKVNEGVKLLSRDEFRDYVYTKVLKDNPNRISAFQSEYESVVYTIDYDQLILGMATTPRLSNELLVHSTKLANKYKRTGEEILKLILEYVGTNVSMRTCKETGTVEPFLFSALHKFFEPSMNGQGRLRVASMDARVNDTDNRSYREISGTSVVSERDSRTYKEVHSVNVYDLVIKIIRGSRVLYRHKRDRASTSEYFYYYDLVSYGQYYELRSIHSRLSKLLHQNQLPNRIRIEDQNFDLSGEAPAGTMRAKQVHRNSILDRIMATGVELSIKNFRHTYGAYLDWEKSKENDKGSVTIEPTSTDRRLITTDAKKHLSQVLYALLAVKELVLAAESAGYTIFDMPIPMFRVNHTGWYEAEAKVSPLSYLNKDTPIVSFMSIMDILQEEGLLERNEESLRRIQQVSFTLLTERDAPEDKEAPVSRNTHWGMITIQRFAGVSEDSDDYLVTLNQIRMMYAVNHDILGLYRQTEDAVGVIMDLFYSSEDELFRSPNRRVLSLEEIMNSISQIKNLLVNFTAQQRRMLFSRTRRIDHSDLYLRAEDDDMEDWHSDREILRQRASLLLNYSKGRDPYTSVLTDPNDTRIRNGISVEDAYGVLNSVEEVNIFMQDTESCIWLPDMQRSFVHTPPLYALMPFSALNYIKHAWESEHFCWEGTSTDFLRLNGVLEVYHKLMIVCDAAESTIQQSYYEEYSTDKVVVAAPEVMQCFTEVISIFDHLDRGDYMRGMQRVEAMLQALDGAFSAANYRSQKYYEYLNKTLAFKVGGNVPMLLKPFYHVPLYLEEDRIQADRVPGMLDFKMKRVHMKVATPHNMVEKIGYNLFRTVNSTRIDFLREVLKVAESCLDFSSMIVGDAETWKESALKEESQRLEGITGKTTVGMLYDELGYARNNNGEYVYQEFPFDPKVEGYRHRSGYVIYLDVEGRKVIRELLD